MSLSGDHGCTGIVDEAKSNGRSGKSPGLFSWLNSHYAHRIRQNDLGEAPVRQHQDLILTENSTKIRDQAESAFSRTQTQFMARTRTISEIDAVAAARDAKTLRLRELRLEKEAAATAKAAASEKSTKR
ncbi:hypothetical protein [Pararhizobium sp. DWP1-1-3]|uniref:hypothetical protein n=1 Tax=Pararhizobium sp. DWP1-1-3 TaxID=2804652 RepID=UPI003CF1AAD9